MPRSLVPWVASRAGVLHGVEDDLHARCADDLHDTQRTDAALQGALPVPVVAQQAETGRGVLHGARPDAPAVRPRGLQDVEERFHRSVLGVGIEQAPRGSVQRHGDVASLEGSGGWRGRERSAGEEEDLVTQLSVVVRVHANQAIGSRQEDVVEVEGPTASAHARHDTGVHRIGRTLRFVPSTPLATPSAARTPLGMRVRFMGRVTQFLLGLLGMGLGLAIMLEAGIGVGPWAVFHDGIARVTPLSFGQALVLVGVGVGAMAWFWTGERPGPGTLVNMALIGPSVDVYRGLAIMPSQEAFLPGLLQFVVGLLVVGFATGTYITARFGAGPRDMFMLGLSQKLRWPIRRTRTTMEAVVLLAGVLLGGSVGLGTLAFALLIGPVVQRSLRLFRYAPKPRS